MAKTITWVLMTLGKAYFEVDLGLESNTHWIQEIMSMNRCPTLAPTLRAIYLTVAHKATSTERGQFTVRRVNVCRG